MELNFIEENLFENEMIEKLTIVSDLFICSLTSNLSFRLSLRLFRKSNLKVFWSSLNLAAKIIN